MRLNAWYSDEIMDRARVLFPRAVGLQNEILSVMEKLDGDRLPAWWGAEGQKLQAELQGLSLECGLSLRRVDDVTCERAAQICQRLAEMVEAGPPQKERRSRVEGCDYCAKWGGRPPHDASDRCESGKREHCSCDTCF